MLASNNIMFNLFLHFYVRWRRRGLEGPLGGTPSPAPRRLGAPARRQQAVLLPGKLARGVRAADSTADMTMSWSRLRWPARDRCHTGPWARKISATSRAGRATRAAASRRRLDRHGELLKRARDLADGPGGDLRVERRGVEPLVPERRSPRRPRCCRDRRRPARPTARQIMSTSLRLASVSPWM